MNAQPIPTEEEWRARFKARLLEHGIMQGDADDILTSINIVQEEDYKLEDNPEEMADERFAEFYDEDDEEEDN